ncbi:hypothetical protein Tco_1434540, partial [Tanacetum coccineum]
HNTDFHQIVDFLEASHIRYALTVCPTVYVSYIRQFWSTARIETTDGGTKIIATVDGKQRTISESSIRRHLKLNDEEGISTFPDDELFENLSLMGYNILPNQSPKSTGFNEFSSNIATAIVCLATNRTYNFSKMILDGMIRNVKNEPASPPRDDSHGEAFHTATSLDAGQDRENIAKTSAMPHEASPRVTSLGSGEGSMQQQLQELIELWGMDQGEDLVEKSTDKGSEDTVEVAHVLSTMEAANMLSSGGAASIPVDIATIALAGVATASGNIPTASGNVPTAAIFTTASITTPSTRRTRASKGIIIESSQPSHTTKLEEEFAQEDQRIREQATRDAEIARIQAEEELGSMIAGLNRGNELIAKYLIPSPTEQTINQEREKDFYMSILRSHAGWKTKDFRGMSFEQIEEKFILVWKQMQDFVPMNSKSESEIQTKDPKELSEEELKKMMEIVPVEEVYIEALQVKRPIIAWEVYSEGERMYWKIIRAGDYTEIHQTFEDMLKKFDREDLDKL